VSAFEELHLTGPAGAALARAGWDATNALVAESVPAVARGQNVVYLAPPAPAWAAPVLAGIASRLAQGGQALLLAPRETLDAWAAQVAALVNGSGIHWHAARGEARALRLLRADQIQLLLLTPESALALVRRSALKLESVTSIALLWPERLPTDVLDLLMQDLPKDSQRIIVSCRPDLAAAMGERHARKALTAGPLAHADALHAPSGPIRVAATPWGSRAQAVAQVIELLDPEHPVVFAVDRSGEAQLREAVPTDIAALVTDMPDAASLIIAWDPPTPDQFARLKDVAEVVLLSPPGAETWPGRLGSLVRPLRLPAFVDDAQARAAQQRAEVQQAVEERTLDAEAMLLAPLFERYDATRVAAALYSLWNARAARPPAPSATTATAAEPTTAKVWISVGQRDEATAGDLVAALVKELGVDRGRIGKIEVRENFSLVELPAAEAPRIAERLAGVSIRRRRVTARVDRGAARPSGRGSRSP
jgi:ATP-dependent RNA helicase DeaD